MKTLKILELTTYSSGVCGVAARVKQEASLLAQKGHEVAIFSTHFVKGADSIAPHKETLGHVHIRRFPAFKLGGESYTYWNFTKAALAFKPDIIIAHAYRHTHTTQALRIAKKLNIPVILVTHAPFTTGGESRSLLAKCSIAFYDKFLGRVTLKQFTKIIAITNWERTALKALDVPEEKIIYIPNGIPEIFFTQKPSTEDKQKILYFGRLAPVKDLETLIRAFALMKNKAATLELAGPAEASYASKLKTLIARLNLTHRVIFTPAIYDLKQKIMKFDSARIYILPSKREGMPQSLIEALARKKLVIASNNLGARDLITHGKNGFLFPIGDYHALASLLDKTLSLPPKQTIKIKNTAYASVKQFAWKKLIDQLDVLLKKQAIKIPKK